MGTRVIVSLAAGIVLLVAAGCGGSTPATDQSQGSSPPSTVASAPPTGSGGAAADSCSTEAVADAEQSSMVDPHAFDPADFTITVGQTITWTNTSTQNHSVSFQGGPDCGIVLIGKSVSVTFDTPGTFLYFDEIVPQYMSGTVTVQ